MEQYFAEGNAVKVLNGPADLDTPVVGARISMKDAKRVAFIVSMGTSTAAVVVAALKQHNAATGGTTKALAVSNPYFHKIAAAASFTKVEPTVAADTYTLSTTFASAAGVVIFEVLEEDLDTNGGFTHISLDMSDTTAAKIGSVLGIIRGVPGPAYAVEV